MAVEENIFPNSFDAEIYAAMNFDLQHLDLQQIEQHYFFCGRDEGRVSSAIRSRSDFVAMISQNSKVLEIGPFDSPCIFGNKVDYLDLLSRSELQNRARDLQRIPENVPEIKWIAPDGTLKLVTEKYDVLFSCHNLEHQTDLISHLQQASNVLNAGCFYFLVVPDCRYCFDHFLNPSSLAQILSAYAEKRSKHTVQSVIEHRIFTTHNDPVRHWAGDHGEVALKLPILEAAILEYQNANGILDVHAWQFTPTTFKEIITHLSALGLISFEIVEIYPTLRNEFEFKAILRNKN